MPGPSFKTNPVQLSELLKRCADGRMQLPEFQRSWVWDDERIRSLIASISRSFPIGALMTLGTGGNLRLKARLERATGQAAYRGAVSTPQQKHSSGRSKTASVRIARRSSAAFLRFGVRRRWGWPTEARMGRGIGASCSA